MITGKLKVNILCLEAKTIIRLRSSVVSQKVMEDDKSKVNFEENRREYKMRKSENYPKFRSIYITACFQVTGGNFTLLTTKQEVQDFEY